MLPRLLPFDPLAFGLDIAREYGDIVYYHVGPLHVYQLTHPDLARQVLVEQPEKFHKAQLIKRAFRPFAGEGLLTSDGALWRQQRRLMQPAFHHAQLTMYGAAMVEHALRMVEAVEDGKVLEINEAMARLTLGIVVKCLFGADFMRRGGNGEPADDRGARRHQQASELRASCSVLGAHQAQSSREAGAGNTRRDDSDA